MVYFFVFALSVSGVGVFYDPHETNILNVIYTFNVVRLAGTLRSRLQTKHLLECLFIFHLNLVHSPPFLLFLLFLYSLIVVHQRNQWNRTTPCPLSPHSVLPMCLPLNRLYNPSYLSITTDTVKSNIATSSMLCSMLPRRRMFYLLIDWSRRSMSVRRRQASSVILLIFLIFFVFFFLWSSEDQFQRPSRLSFQIFSVPAEGFLCSTDSAIGVFPLSVLAVFNAPSTPAAAVCEAVRDQTNHFVIFTLTLFPPKPFNASHFLLRTNNPQKKINSPLTPTAPATPRESGVFYPGK